MIDTTAMTPTSATSGKVANKENIPYEIKNRMRWDPEYKKQHQHEYPPSDDSDEYIEIDEEPYSGTYVSGGGQAGASKSPTPQPINRPGSVATTAKQADTSDDGFRPVSYNRNPKKASNPYGKPPVKRRILQRLDMNFKRDNLAKAAYRKHTEPKLRFVLNKDCDEIEPSQVDMYDFLEELGVRLGSFIRPPQHNRDRELLLWGNDEQVKRTKRELQRWMLRSSSPSDARGARKPTERTDRPGEKFAKVYSTAGEKWKKENREMKKKADRQKFQQIPEKGKAFKYNGRFIWPVDGLRPQDILGESLEALDSVRVGYHCHILFDDQVSEFKILTDNIKAVIETFGRIEGIAREAVARLERPITRFYIEPLKPSVHRNQVRIIDGPNPDARKISTATGNSSNLSSSNIATMTGKDPSAGASKIPTTTGKALDPWEREHWSRLSAHLTAQKDRGIEDALRSTIPNLACYRGDMRMRVEFGTFALTQYRWPADAESISFEEFVESLALPGTKGTLVKDLYIKKANATIMEKVYKADRIFQPIDNMVFSLEAVVPSFRGYFECCEPGQLPMTFQVDVVNNAGERSLYEKPFGWWSITGREEKASPLNMFMIRLDGGPSWKLHASTVTGVDRSRITPSMITFAKSMAMRKMSYTDIEITGEKVFQWNTSLATMEVKAFTQQTLFRYRLVQNMDWMVEISRYDTYGILYRQNTQNMPEKTRWAATLWNTEWDSVFMANSRLLIGQTAEWDPRLGTFFPNTSGAPSSSGINSGVAEFLQIVGQVSSFLEGVKKELPHLRS